MLTKFASMVAVVATQKACHFGQFRSQDWAISGVSWVYNQQLHQGGEWLGYMAAIRSVRDSGAWTGDPQESKKIIDMVIGGGNNPHYTYSSDTNPTDSEIISFESGLQTVQEYIVAISRVLNITSREHVSCSKKLYTPYNDVHIWLISTTSIKEDTMQTPYQTLS